jgi:hypothetical protein
VATLKGELYFWNIKEAAVVGNIDCKRDIKGGRLSEDRQTSKNTKKNKYFTSI